MFARCLDTEFAHLAAKDSACIDIEYILFVDTTTVLVFIATGIPWNLFQPFLYRAYRELTIPEAERTTRILNDGN